MAGVAEDVASGDSNAEEAPKKRIYSACVHCKARKRRCDGVEPSCGLCTRLNVPCVYTQRRKRGPGRKNKPMDLDGRIQSVEVSLQQMYRLRVTEDPTTNDDEVGGQLSHETSQGEQSDGFGITQSSRSEPNPGRSLENPASLAHSDHGRAAIQSAPAGPPHDPGKKRSLFDLPFPAKELFSRSDLLNGLREARNEMETHMDRTPFTRRVFTPFPPREFLVDMEKPVMEEVQLFCPTMARGDFLELIDQHYADGPNNCDSNPARWATINALFGAAVHWRTANDSFEDIGLLGWGFFKNAYAIFPELIIQGNDVRACEAMLAMATFSLGTADARTTSQLASAAARTAQIIGLHRRDTYVNIDRAEAERRKRVFWATYILNTDMMIRYGLTSPLAQGDETPELPTEDPVVADGRLGEAVSPPAIPLKKMAELSRIQAKIYEKFSQHNLQLQSGTDHHVTMIASNCELDEWKNALPEDMRPDSAALQTSRELDAHTALLHFTYFNSLIKMHSSLARIKNAASVLPSSPLYTVWINREAFPSVEQSHAQCTSAARAIIDLLRVMPPQAFVHLWVMLSYPVMACLILLWSALEEPMGPEAHLNVRMIGQFVQILAGHLEDGCDLRNALDGCSKFYKIAKYAVHTQRTIRLSRPLDEDQDVRDQLEALRLKLSGVTDWMHLAQGLLSNMPVLGAQARDIFGDVLRMELNDGGYGILAPDVLKPHKHNFCFGP